MAMIQASQLISKMEEVSAFDDWLTIECKFLVKFADGKKNEVAWVVADYFNRTFNIEGCFAQDDTEVSSGEMTVHYVFSPKVRYDWIGHAWKRTPVTTAEQKSNFLKLLRSVKGEIDCQFGDHSCPVALSYGINFVDPSAMVTLSHREETLEISLAMYTVRKNRNNKRGAEIVTINHDHV